MAYLSLVAWEGWRMPVQGPNLPMREADVIYGTFVTPAGQHRSNAGLSRG